MNTPQPAATPLLDQINTERSTRLRELRNASVFVYADVPDKRLYDEPSVTDAFRDGRKFATGIVVSPQGVMLTNVHVLHNVCMTEEQQRAATIEDVYCAVVKAGHTQVHRAKVTAIDLKNDLARLQILGVEGAVLASVPVASAGSELTLEGREVFVNGIPFGYANMAVTGTVSNAPDNDEFCSKHQLRVTVAAVSGNSGGGILDVGTGKLVGVVVSVRVLEKKDSTTLFFNVTCAVPAWEIRALLEK